ncbi:MAG: winged helix-turn-helix domain-containing protein, partial [Verrucomicrobiia bacterium]
MNTITFLDLAKKVLEEANEPVTVEEIWDYAVSEGYDKQLATKGKTPWATLGARLFVTVRDDPNTPFVKLGQRPTRFFLKSRIKGNEDELLLK